MPGIYTPDVLTGFEPGSGMFGSGNPFSKVEGDVTIQTTVKRSGDRALKTNTTSTTRAWTMINPPLRNPGTSYVYVRFESLPTTDCTVAYTVSGFNETDNAIGIGFNSATGKFRGFRFQSTDGVTHSADGPTVATDTWYKLSWRATLDGAPTPDEWRLDWYVNDEAQPGITVSSDNGLGNWSGRVLGQGPLSWTSVSASVAYYDDLIAGGDNETWPVTGDYEIFAVVPTGMGTHVNSGNFRHEDGTAIDANTYTRVDDKPMNNDALWFEQFTADATSYIEFTVSGVTGENFHGVQAWLSHGAATSDFRNGQFRVIDVNNSNASETIVGGFQAGTVALQGGRLGTRISGGSPWTAADLNALLLRCGFGDDVDPPYRYLSLMLEIARYPVASADSWGYGWLGDSGLSTAWYYVD